LKALACFLLVMSFVTLTRSAVAELPPDVTEGPPVAFFAILTADDESAPTESPGTGRVDFLLDRKTLRLSWKGTYSGLPSKVESVFLHGPQTIGGEAAMLFDLSPGGIKSPFEGSVVLTDGQVEYLVTGRFYVNVHTVKYPNGELRGQINRIPPKDATKDLTQ
jgi:hypothetical protein